MVNANIAKQRMVLQKSVINYASAIMLMQKLKLQTDDIAVCVDCGWGDSPLEISIILDGNGQKPQANISQITYKLLLKNNIIGLNNLQTYKARKNHQYLGT